MLMTKTPDQERVVSSPIESLHDAIVFGARDWSLGSDSAWIYGIIVGWDAASLRELAATYAWSEASVARLQQLHADFVALKKS